MVDNSMSNDGPSKDDSGVYGVRACVCVCATVVDEVSLKKKRLFREKRDQVSNGALEFVGCGAVLSLHAAPARVLGFVFVYTSKDCC